MKFAWVAVLFALLTVPAFAYTVKIHAPAVLGNDDVGVLTNITLNITAGTGYINFSAGGGPVAQDTMQSAATAVQYAANYSGVNPNKYNYYFSIESNSSGVSGPSAGLALTLLTISGIEHRQLNNDFILTGTISSNGTVGPIGGVYDKMQAAKADHAQFMILPELPNSSFDYMIYYLSQQVYGIPVVEVSNVSQAIPYAFGNTPPVPIRYNINASYNITDLPDSNSICPSCGGQIFSELTNYTFNFTSQEITAINSTKFSEIQSQLRSLTNEDRMLEGKGYFYSGADLAFIAYPTDFVFANYNYSTQNKASQLIQSIYYYCQGVNASTPQMTTNNYELVIGGQARIAWAMQTLNESLSALNSSQTSDDVLASLELAAPSYAWCTSAAKMYNISEGMGGQPVALSQEVLPQITSQLGRDSADSGQVYYDAAKQSYNNGDYGAALYSLTYANIFENVSISSLYNVATENSSQRAVMRALNSSQGIWPSQFALQSYFYLYQARQSDSNTSRQIYFNNAYTTAHLSLALGSTNNYITSNFVNASSAAAANGPVSAQLVSLQQEVNEMLAVLIVLLIILIVILVLVFMHFVEHNRPAKPLKPVKNTKERR